MYEIRFLEQGERQDILSLLRGLDPSISQVLLEERLEAMFGQGYLCVGVFEGKKLIGISGLWVLVKYYIGKHVEPDNVYILPEYQGKGVGAQLVDWIFRYANSIGCQGSELNCYVNNVEAQKFWERQGYRILGYHYQKKFKGDETDR